MFELLLIFLVKWDKLVESKKRSRKSEEWVVFFCFGWLFFENWCLVILDFWENEGKNRGEINLEFIFMYWIEFDIIIIFIFLRN